MRLGRFVVIEGLDGAGTTTQCAAIAGALREQGRDVVVTAEPSPGPIGVMIRQALGKRLIKPDGGPLTPDTLALLFAADRVDHLASEIEPAVARGAIVLSDRYLLSSLAYQGMQVGMARVSAVNATARAPDLTLFLRVTPEVAARRRHVRGAREELYEAEETQRRVAKQYERAIALRRRAGDRVEIIDGAHSREQITALCVERIATLGARRRR